MGDKATERLIMKTNRMVLLLVLLVAFCGHEAQAFYNASTGRWLSRDPIGEQGGVNLTGFVRNSPPSFWDRNGLFSHSHGCNAQQLSAIRMAEFTADFYTTWAIWVLDSQFNTWDVIGRNAEFAQRYLNEPAFANMYRGWYLNSSVTFALMDRGFAANKYGVECECWCSGDKEAYVKPELILRGWDDDIHFCPRFFQLTPRQQAVTFLHEFSHYFADTDDLGLGGGMPFEKNPLDAYWIQDVVGDPLGHFNLMVNINMVYLFPRP